jgi:Zn-finger protein
MNNRRPTYYQNPYYPVPPYANGYYYHLYAPYYVTQYPENQQKGDTASKNKGEKGKQNKDSKSNKAKNENKMEEILKKIEKIEQENSELKKKIEDIKPINVENVNYKIQDLSVQELSGSLLVGLTALSDAENLKELLQENGPVTFNDIDTEDVETNVMNESETSEQNDNS